MDSTDVGVDVDEEKTKYSKAPPHSVAVSSPQFVAVYCGWRHMAILYTIWNSCSQTFMGAKLG
jgi:hypothetical protein